MKVHGPPPTSLPSQPRALRGAQDGFAPVSAESRASASTRAGASAAAASLDMLLALQEAATPTEKRRRAMRRGHGILDALDELKLAAFDGDEPDAAALDRLSRALRDAREQTEDPGLDDVLDQIELRAAVELAKRDRRPTA